MNNRLSKEQIEDLIEQCGSKPTYWKDGNMQICCPVHGEKRASMGVSHDLQKCHCFSCGFSGTFDNFLINSLPDDFGYDTTNEESEKKTWGRAINKARKYLQDRYEVEFIEVKKRRFKRIQKYEDMVNESINESDDKQEIPLYKIAVFKSGVETYKYLNTRGFGKDVVKKYMIGRDLDNKTVTIPVFNSDGTLAGVIGRYIDKNRAHNERYKIYDNFERGKILYPLDKFELLDNTIIGVEGQFDAIRMHELGFTNTLARMTNFLTIEQANWISEHCETYIDLVDNDSMGLKAIERNKKLLHKKVNYLIVDYPDHGKDPCDWDFDEIDYMTAHAHSTFNKKIRRI